MLKGIGINVMARFPLKNQQANKVAVIWLLSSLSLTFAILAFHLNHWVTLCFAVMAIWRYLIAINSWPFPGLWLRLLITTAGGLAVLTSYGTLFGRDAGIALFAVMISLKLLETRTQRDFIVMVILGYFLTINTMLFTQAIWVSLVILLTLVGLTACLVNVSYPNKRLNWKTQAKLSGSLIVQGTPIMLVLFVLFPRIPGPIWGIPHDTYSGMTGLSDTMEPGNISQLSLSSKIAFRVQFKSTIPANKALYWRGPVLWHQAGRSWQMTSEKISHPQESLQTYGEATDYIITLEPHNRNWLLMLDVPTLLPSDASMNHDRLILSKEPVRTRLRYQGRSYLHYALGEVLSENERTLALQLIEDENPKTVQLANQWISEKKSPDAIIQAALNMFREQAFTYTLAPPLLGNDPVDDFLFHTKQGFCEHYASSFVYLMRAAGMPARIVTGYQGGEFNPSGNYLIVRQSDAHAWAEVWLKGQGWVRIDPTAAVSPDRIESGIGSALADSELLPVLARQDSPLLKKLTLNIDALNNGWNQWVLGYDQQKQLKLIAHLMQQQIAWEDIGLLLVLAITVLMVIISYFLLRNKTVEQDPLKKVYQQFLDKLKCAGIKKLANEGIINFGERAANGLPAQAYEIQEISHLFSSLQYAKPSGTVEMHHHAFYLLKQKVKNFRVNKC